jgi:hypothetical protein
LSGFVIERAEMGLVRAQDFVDLGDPASAAAAMREGVRLLMKRKKYTALLVLIACYIDALAGGNKRKYMVFLEKEFPELCDAMPPKEFYERIRNGMVHDFRPKPGYILLEERETGGSYICEAQVRGRPDSFRGLNVDRLASDFLRIVNARSGLSLDPEVRRRSGHKGRKKESATRKLLQ